MPSGMSQVNEKNAPSGADDDTFDQVTHGE
jgi:hypothetical protein